MTRDLFQAIERGATVVTAEHRLARSLRREHALAKQRSGAAWWPEPRVVPWYGWLERCWRDVLYSSGDPLPPVLTAFQEEMLWESAISASPASGDLLQLGATARAARRSWALLKAWRLPTTGPWWEHSPDAIEFLGWARAFNERCDRARKLDPAVLADRLRPRISPPRELWFVGFDELTPQQRDAAEAFGAVVAPPRTEPAGTASLRQFPTLEDELEAAAEWARDIVGAHQTASVGIVVPNLGESRRMVARIFGKELGDAVHVSYGEPLPDAPPIHAALQLLQLARPVVAMEVVSALLLSPHVAGWEGERGERARFDAWLRSQGRLEWSWRSARRHERCPERIGAAMAEWETVADGTPPRQHPSAWARTMTHLLQCFGWTSGSALLQRAWERAMSAMASLDPVMDEVSAGSALTLLRRAAARAQVEQENTGEPVQVISLDESCGLEFDHLWIAGMDAAAWPRATSPDPFLPVSLQRERALPHCSPARELDSARAATALLLAAAPSVVVTYSVGAGDSRVGPSPLVARLPREDQPRPVATVAPPPMQSIVDARGPAVDLGQWQAGGTTALRLQASCPFRAFAEIRLGARPLEEPELGLDPREKGKAMHAAMEIVWRELRDAATLRATSADELARLVSRAVQQALRDQRPFPGTPFEERLSALERQRLTRIVAEWLEMEKTRVGDFVVAQVESAREVEIGGLRLRTRIDRVDQLTGGQIALIDYKSGEPSVTSWEGDRPDEPQLPLYAVTQSMPVAAVAFGQVRTGAIQFKGYTARDGLLPKAKLRDEAEFAEMTDAWRTALGTLATGFREGDAAVDPKSSAECDRCHLHVLCRIADHGSPGGGA